MTRLIVTIAILATITACIAPPERSRPAPSRAICVSYDSLSARPATGLDPDTIDCGDDIVIPCERGVEACSCVCDPEWGDCRGSLVYVRQRYGVHDLHGQCVASRCEWSRVP